LLKKGQQQKKREVKKTWERGKPSDVSKQETRVQGTTYINREGGVLSRRKKT